MRPLSSANRPSLIEPTYCREWDHIGVGPGPGRKRHTLPSSRASKVSSTLSPELDGKTLRVDHPPVLRETWQRNPSRGHDLLRIVILRLALRDHLRPYQSRLMRSHPILDGWARISVTQPEDVDMVMRKLAGAYKKDAGRQGANICFPASRSCRIWGGPRSRSVWVPRRARLRKLER